MEVQFSRTFQSAFVMYLSFLAESCSSRSTPKPRPSLTSTSRPNVTYHTYACSPEYAAWYCLNGGTCFTVKVGESLLENCECPDGFMGQRCDFKALDGSYLPARQRIMLETASIASGATVAVFLVVAILTCFYIHFRRKHKYADHQHSLSEVDGNSSELAKRAVFSSRCRPNNHNRIPLRQLNDPSGMSSGDRMMAAVYHASGSRGGPGQSQFSSPAPAPLLAPKSHTPHTHL